MLPEGLKFVIDNEVKPLIEKIGMQYIHQAVAARDPTHTANSKFAPMYNEGINTLLLLDEYLQQVTIGKEEELNPLKETFKNYLDFCEKRPSGDIEPELSESVTNFQP